MSTAVTKFDRRILVAAAIVASVLGTVHGFSVFLEPLEAKFAAPRASISLTYSMTLVAITFAVLNGHRVFARWSPARFLAGVTALAAIGALVAGFAPNLATVWLGYSLIFGLANGLGYGFALQISAQSQPGREGWAMGVVTAAYALGAMVAPAAFVKAMTFGGFGAAMILLAVVIVACGLLASRLMHGSGARFQVPPVGDAPVRVRALKFATLWVGYGAGVAAGLMIIGHAAGISRALDPMAATWIAPAIVAICNLVGSLFAGWIADKVSPGKLLAMLPLISGLGALALLTGGATALYPALGAIGFAYGAIIAACPAAVAARFGMLEGPRVYGRVFTAWGFSGLAAPVAAAWLFDVTGGYSFALWVVVALAALASLSSNIASRGNADH